MKKLRILFVAACASLMAALDRITAPPGAIALANELGGIYDHGRETVQVDPAATLPVGTKYLIYIRGSAYNYAKIADGGATLASCPLGFSADAPFQIGDYFEVDRFGAIKGTALGQSLGAITIDHLVYSAAGGLVGDLNTAGNGTYWVIGRAIKTVAGANQDISFIPQFPQLMTVTGGAFALATPL